MQQMQKRQRAAMYARMSTDLQQFSIDHQVAIMTAYAEREGIELVELFADYGKSGLKINNRHELQRLLGTIQSGSADFDSLLVLDVSRWGRFQDIDESAYYEYLCRKNGIAVHYVGEQFQNDGSAISSILKAIKRVMAAEYSRELSAKVFAARNHLAQQGFRQGGFAGLGLRRAVVNEQGKLIKVLESHERKSFPTHRIILVPGPKREVALVNKIYKDYIHREMSMETIARHLNESGILTDRMMAWTRATVRGVLTNEKYIGNLVLNRQSFKIQEKPNKKTPADSWVRADAVYEAIVPTLTFQKAAAKIQTFGLRRSNDSMLQDLRALLKREGRLTACLIDRSSRTTTARSYAERFGSIRQAYKLIGYDPPRKFAALEERAAVKEILQCTVNELIARTSLAFEVKTKAVVSRLMQVGPNLVSIVPCRHFLRLDRIAEVRWVGTYPRSHNAQFALLAQLGDGAREVKRYYVLPIKHLVGNLISFPCAHRWQSKNRWCVENLASGTLADVVHVLEASS